MITYKLELYFKVDNGLYLDTYLVINFLSMIRVEVWFDMKGPSKVDA